MKNPILHIGNSKIDIDSLSLPTSDAENVHNLS